MGGGVTLRLCECQRGPAVHLILWRADPFVVCTACFVAERRELTDGQRRDEEARVCEVLRQWREGQPKQTEMEIDDGAA